MPISSKGIGPRVFQYSEGTHESGRRRQRSNEPSDTQINTEFNEFSRAMDRDSAPESNQFSVGSGQSTINKEAHKLGSFYALNHLNFFKTATLDRRLKFRNLDISVETDAGNYRHWYDPHNKEHGKTKMLYPYGYIRMSEGMDGDHVDCFVGPNETAEYVYVITTNKAPEFRIADEQKCMLGFDSPEEAKAIFLRHYTKPEFFREMTALPYDEFEQKVFDTKNTTRKKIAFKHDIHAYLTIDNNVGPSHDAVPGDYLGLPRTSLVGIRSVKGDQVPPQAKIHRGFRSMDDPNYVTSNEATSIDGNVDALPSDPAV